MADWTDFYTSGEARRIFEEGERRNVEVFLRRRMHPDAWHAGMRIVTYSDWLRASELRRLCAEVMAPHTQ